MSYSSDRSGIPRQLKELECNFNNIGVRTFILSGAPYISETYFFLLRMRRMHIEGPGLTFKSLIWPRDCGNV
jgi:hypothetical protein